MRVDRAALPFLLCAVVLITAGGLVAAINSAAPFDHGSWLAAYLVLVGGVAQAALALGATALRASPAPALLELCLWLAGSLGVPAGVLADMPALVAVGSAPLLAALILFARGVASARVPARTWQAIYLLVAGSLAVSVAVGMGLAGALP